MMIDQSQQRVALHPGARRAMLGARVAFACTLAMAMGLADASATAPNGSFDPSFGNYLPGRTLVAFSSPSGSSAEPFAMAVLADGRLVLAGDWTGPESGGFVNMTVIRLDANGAVDPPFGSDGVARIVPPGAFASSANAVFELDDGKLLVAGYASYANEPDDNTDFIACRLDSNGALDLTYGEGGCRRVGFDLVPNGSDAGQAATLDATGRLVIAGRVSINEDVMSNKFGVVRLDPDGAIDASFGVNGRSLVTRFSERAGMSTNDLPRGIGVANDGRIVVVGKTTYADGRDGGSNFAVARLSATGVIDATFGDGGVFVYDADDGADAATAVGFQRNGRIIVGGTVMTLTPSFAAIALTTSGALDPSFSTAGRMIYCFECNGNSQFVYAMLIQPDDRIVLAGLLHRSAANETGNLLAALRLLPDGAMDLDFGNFGASGSGLFAQSFFLDDTSPLNVLSALALQGDRIVAAGSALDAERIPSGSAFLAIRLSQDQIFDSGFE